LISVFPASSHPLGQLDELAIAASMSASSTPCLWWFFPAFETEFIDTQAAVDFGRSAVFLADYFNV
jgi:hypothetical protein